MGLESYLFHIYFKPPVPEDEIISLFETAGMMHLSDKFRKRTANNYGDFFFELRTGNGLTQVHILLAPGDYSVSDFSLRFSIASPKTVISQTFQFLQRLSELREIIVYDTEIRNHIFRQLRQQGQVDQHFQGLDPEDDKSINKQCFISLNVNDFIDNKPGITKRQILAGNEKGAIIEGGAATLDYVEKKGLFERFFGWIKKEL